MTPALLSIVVCPACGASTTAMMPTNACTIFWPCPHCQEVIQPDEGDCCVYCSYGDTPCPPVQHEQAMGCPSKPPSLPTTGQA